MIIKKNNTQNNNFDISEKDDMYNSRHDNNEDSNIELSEESNICKVVTLVIIIVIKIGKIKIVKHKLLKYS